MLQFDAKDGGLNFVETKISPKQLVVVLRPEAMAAQQPDLIRKVLRPLSPIFERLSCPNSTRRTRAKARDYIHTAEIIRAL